MLRCIFPLGIVSTAVIYSNAFAFFNAVKVKIYENQPVAICANRTPSDSVTSVGDLLSDLPTPSLLIELSLAEDAVSNNSMESSSSDHSPLLTDVLNDPIRTHSLNGLLFVHTQITDTSVRDTITRRQGSGHSQVIGRIDVSPELVSGGAYLGIGLANHHVGGYYWARGLGTGASLPAHGVFLRPYESKNTDDEDKEGGELYWKKRGAGKNAVDTTEDSSNSNDGKRSEWADFVVVGDTVQLVPEDTPGVLNDSQFMKLFGMRRIGRPRGADPIVERIWVWDMSIRKWVEE